MEEDEAGRLRAFRNRFGRGWDADTTAEGDEEGEEGEEGKVEDESLLDLISGYGQEAKEEGTASGVIEAKERSGMGKGGES